MYNLEIKQDSYGLRVLRYSATWKFSQLYSRQKSYYIRPTYVFPRVICTDLPER
jgi:hypothetical protein